MWSQASTALGKHLGSQGEHRFPSQRNREAGRTARERVEGGAGGGARGRAGLRWDRLLGFVYLGGRHRGGLAVGGLRAKASSFGDRGGRGWVLGGRRGADYDRGGHGEVGALCGEGLLAPLLQWAAHSGSEATPTDPRPPHPDSQPPQVLRRRGWWESVGGNPEARCRSLGIGSPRVQRA